jgi:HD-GYP domain-containing protein (c-di-GMP phosphodiesterase class II)
MDDRTRSVHKRLVISMLLAAVVLSVVAGAAVAVREYGRIENGINERAVLGGELLRARVRALVQQTGAPWQNVAQQALEDLAILVPRPTFGRFVFVVIHDRDGRRVARLTDDTVSGIKDIVASFEKAGFPVPEAGPRLTKMASVTGLPQFEVAAPVEDRTGRRAASIYGIFVVSPEAVARSREDVAGSVGATVMVVILVTALLYPVIRRLLVQLGGLTVHLLDANLETIQLLGNAIAKRDSDTDAHNYRVTIYAVRLAEAAGEEAATIRRLIKGAFLHDVGKIGVRDKILLKEGRLTTEEFAEMKKHVQHGLDIVAACHWLKDASEVVGCHHEKYDGSGYDHGLRGGDIPMSARLFAIADVFDALTSERPYKKPLGYDETMKILSQGAGAHFDPELLAVFQRIAPGLHRSFTEGGIDPHREMQGITQLYFKSDLSVIMQEAAEHTPAV